ncbi:hypothetical protein Salat_1839700 [Sesamum alatum]|uniref:Uncharacterized protein n=1 Tax=Sesamum alatum TaxID=300844 RepID=A0AAE1Y320_9LAMI|nr:hypothetical protein Salat_1839700 [Sesamum alatum]
MARYCARHGERRVRRNLLAINYKLRGPLSRRCHGARHSGCCPDVHLYSRAAVVALLFFVRCRRCSSSSTTAAAAVGDGFGLVVEAFGQYDPGMKPPSYHEVRVTYLKKKLEHTRTILREHDETKSKYGCSLMADDPILLDEIDESNEWLLWRLTLDDSDEENVNVFEDDDLTWGDVAQATGVDENAYNFRSRPSQESKANQTHLLQKQQKKQLHHLDLLGTIILLMKKKRRRKKNT